MEKQSKAIQLFDSIRSNSNCRVHGTERRRWVSCVACQSSIVSLRFESKRKSLKRNKCEEGVFMRSSIVFLPQLCTINEYKNWSATSFHFDWNYFQIEVESMTVAWQNEIELRTIKLVFSFPLYSVYCSSTQSYLKNIASNYDIPVCHFQSHFHRLPSVR